MTVMKSALALLLAFPILAQTPQVTVLRAARMFAGNSDSISTPGVVVITGNRITAVGASATIPANATVIDLGDATLLPGFIDSHTHLSFEMSPNYISDFFTLSFRRTSQQAHYAAPRANRTQDDGFTRVRDTG